MEVELGLKITKTRDDVTSISDFQFAKDRAVPLFLSKQTDALFILTAHLRVQGIRMRTFTSGLARMAKLISVSGETAVQEMEIIPLKKEVKIKDFRKKLKIPDGVLLAKIRANYNEEESILTIVMPKMVKGTSGIGIEEVEEEDIDRKAPEPEQVVAEKPAENGAEEKIQEKKRRKPKKPCPPLLIGGSSLLVSLIFLVIHFIRDRRKLIVFLLL